MHDDCSFVVSDLTRNMYNGKCISDNILEVLTEKSKVCIITMTLYYDLFPDVAQSRRIVVW